MDDWRDQLLPDIRQSLVQKIIQVSERYHAVLDEEGLLELQKIAQRAEEKAYATGTTVSDYRRIIDLKLNTMEIEGLYPKIQTMKETYLPELNEIYQEIVTKLQQLDSPPQQPQSDKVEKLKIFKFVLERIIAFLEISKSQILPGTGEKLRPYEIQIKNFISVFRARRAMTLQQGRLPQPRTLQPQSRVYPQNDVANSISLALNWVGNCN